jgi:hypothetical protein
MAGIDHQPLVIRLVNQNLQQFLPDTLVPPAYEATVRVAPPSVLRRKIPPGRSCPQYPEDSIDETASVLGNATLDAFASR